MLVYEFGETFGIPPRQVEDEYTYAELMEWAAFRKARAVRDKPKGKRG